MSSIEPQTKLLNLLNGVTLFGGLSEKSKEALCRICSERVYKKGTHLFFEGDKGENVFLLALGNIELYKTTPEGKSITIRLVRKGELFAEVVLFENDRYPVNAIAVRESLVFILPRGKFKTLFAKDYFRDDFLRLLMHKQRYLTERILYFTSNDVEERFFKFLIDHYGIRDSYHLTISKKHIASSIGTNPETLSRLLARLSHLKIITLQGKKLSVTKEFLKNYEA